MGWLRSSALADRWWCDRALCYACRHAGATAFRSVIGPGDADLVGRVALATVLGALVGAERELGGRPAGLRTHALVSLGAASFTVAAYAALPVPGGGGLSVDLTRIAAQVVTGIGFLGAGVILYAGGRLRGLTTAADLWAVAAIGVLCGVGLPVVASATTGLVLVVVAGMRPVERVLERLRQRLRLTDLSEGSDSGEG